MSETLAEATGLVLAPEVTLKTPPGAGTWVTAQPNPGGIAGFEPLTKTVERDPLSKFATPEKGDVVGLDVELSITTDLNKDTVDLVAESVFRCTGKHPGNKSQRLYRPTAVTSTGYTVPAAGDLSNGLLIYARGFTNAANNGLKLLAGTSITTEIKTTGLVVEASPPANATVDVVGVRGAAGDITITAANHLASTILDFTTLGIQVGQWLTVGGLTASTAFTTIPAQSRARVVSVAAHLITLERWAWTVAGVDSGAAKTIDIGLGSLYRNYTLDSANYKKATLHAELEQQGPGTAGVATYTYAQGLATTQWDVDAALESKITSMLKFVGLDIPDPVLVGSRVTGPSTAYLPQAADLADTATDLKQVRLTDSTGVMSAVEVNTWKFSANNNIKGKKVQGTLGNTGHLYGKFNFSVSMEVYFNDYNAIKAARDSRDMQWDAFLNNGQFGLMFDLPNVALRNPKRTFPANEPVMLSCDIPAFRDTADNIAGSLTVFGYVP
jgi:hypothetical protein